MAIKPKRILLTGGGSGGHITPILAVAHEIKKQSRGTKTIYVGEKGSKFKNLTSDHKAIDYKHSIYAGKYRRYYKQVWYKKILDVKTLILNIRDMFLVVIGFFQALKLIDKEKPDIVFLKGGYVGVPVGLAAAFRKKTIITHDSDAVPGLANRIVSRWVSIHATALPVENYNYPKEITKQVGVLVQHDYIQVNSFLKKKYKQRLKLPANAPVLVVTGGSSGAITINKAIEALAPKLLKEHKNLYIIHQAGKGKAKNVRHSGNPRYSVLEFFDPMFMYLGAADIVITRASANTLAELGVQAKATIVVPSPHLADGHQLKNGEFLEKNAASIVIQDDNDLAENILKAVNELFANTQQRITLGKNLHKNTPVGAAKKLAQYILEFNNETKS